MCLNKDNKILISVIIPTYNNEKTIGRCLESFLTQNFDGLELICIDDYSNDATVTICNSYAEKYKEVKVYSKSVEKKGVAESRNIGINKASGNIIGFADGDDEAYLNSLNIIEKLFRINPNVNVISGGYLILDNNKFKSYKVYGKYKITSLGRLSEKALYKKYVGGYLWNKFFRKEIIINNKLDPNLIIGEDLNFIVKLGIQYADDNALIIPDILYKYILNNDSVTTSNNVDDYYISKELIRSLKECEKNFQGASSKLSRILSYRIYSIALDTKRVCVLDNTQSNFIITCMKENRFNYFLMYYLNGKDNTINFIRHSLSHIKILRTLYKRIISRRDF